MKMRIDKSYKYKDFTIPEHMVDALVNYVDHGRITSNFLKGIIANNLIVAVKRADDENLRNIPAYVEWLIIHAPGESYGTLDKMNTWIRNHESKTDNETYFLKG